jgi:hypothetical protein
VVDPVSLGAITTGLIVKAVDRAEDDSLDAGSGALRRLLGFLRDRFSRDDDAPASTALARVEDAPDSPSRRQDLAAAIAALAQRDEEFRTELERLIGEARRAGIEVGSSQTATGNQNVQAAGLVDSEVRVSYGSPPPSPPDHSSG